MFEYQISVSLNGRFLFRTDWESDCSRARANFTLIQSSMPLAKVVVVSRSLARHEVSFIDIV